MRPKVDLTRFHAALARMMDVPKKHGPDVLNKSVLQVVVGSGGNKGLVQLTRKATEQRIREDLSRMVTSVGKRGGSHSVPLVVLLATQWLTERGERPAPGAIRPGSSEAQDWRNKVSHACQRVIAARIQSRAFIAAGWLWAAAELAPKVPGNTLSRLMGSKNLPLKSGGEAARSFAIAAHTGKLFAGVYNTSSGAGVICTTGVIQLAVNGETNNLRQYFLRGLGDGIKKAVRVR